MRFLTNFSKKDRKKYEKAIKKYAEETGDCCLVLCDLAFDCNKRMLKDCNSLYTTENKNLSPFWRIFESIKVRGKE